MTFRILHVDDEPDIREVVELSLSLDPELFVRSCGSGTEALAMVPHWAPDMILCDVMMPVMDGPTTLARLRERPQTADTPVVFMTARAQTRELEHFGSLGAIGVIPKPFDPMTLAASVRSFLRSARFNKVSGEFATRLRATLTTLAGCRPLLRTDPTPPAALQELQNCAHNLSGAAGVFGLEKISAAASALEDASIGWRCGRGSAQKVGAALDLLVQTIERELGNNELGVAT